MILLAAMPLALAGVLIVGGTIVLAVVGLLAVRRLVPVPTLRSHNDVAGFIFATLGVIYAVLLALVVVALWTALGFLAAVFLGSFHG
ncbi:MAG: hypothetical protein HYU88_11345 [Chloroflexi bacterium]|nr:hypothetical protein [Chloroflexota bacterium]MBI4506932.1 hypothetical protein [Chloroflexota bacterium]